MPSLLQSVSYIFCFHGLMCGPFCFYKDYIAFIDGTNYISEPTQVCFVVLLRCNIFQSRSVSASVSMKKLVVILVSVFIQVHQVPL